MLMSQKMRKLAPELDPLRLGTGWKSEDLSKPQIFIESTFGDSHPGSGHLDRLVAAAREGIAEAGGFGARYFCMDMCDGESQGTDGINFSLASREMIANMIEIQANATPFDAGIYIASCDKGMPGNLMGLARVNIPAVVVTGGTMAAGPDLLTLEQLGMYSAKFERGEIDADTLDWAKRNACPGCGHVPLSAQLPRCRLWLRLWDWLSRGAHCSRPPARISSNTPAVQAGGQSNWPAQTACGPVIL